MVPADLLELVRGRLERLADRRRHKARCAGMEPADLVQAGLVAALESLPRRNPRMTDEQAANWLTLRAVHAMADEMRLRGTYKRGHMRRVIDGQACRLYSLSARVYDCPAYNRELCTLDTLADPTSPDPTAGHDDAAEWAEAVQRAVGGTDPTEWRVIDGYYRGGRTMRAVGDTLGLSEGRVSQIHSGLIARARERAGAIG